MRREHGGCAGVCGRGAPARSLLERPAGEPVVTLRFKHEDVVPAHLVEPGRGHHRAHASGVNQHESRVAYADVLVGRLHQLAARRMTRSGDSLRFEFLLRPHIE